MAANTFAHSRTENEFLQPEYADPQMDRFAVPHSDADAPYMDSPSGGWAPSLRLSPAATPDTMRLGTFPERDYRPDPARPPEEFWQKLDADRDSRYSPETVVGTGIPETKEFPGFEPASAGANRWARNPRENPPPEPRWTSRLMGASYRYLRPFDQLNRGNSQDGPVGSARHLNGGHFSMADHRRNYEILGMAPARSRRSTFRIDPLPWDTDVVDMPPPPTYPEARIQAVDVPYTSRSWRL